MRILLILNCIIFLFIANSGCSSEANQPLTKHYVAISKRDTGMLKLSRYKDNFFGQYILKHGKGNSDSGEIRGKIIGDTLIGDYFYFPASGTKKKRVPFTLLTSGNTLKLGKGAISRFLDIPYYSPETPIDYEEDAFIFHEIAVP